MLVVDLDKMEGIHSITSDKEMWWKSLCNNDADKVDYDPDITDRAGYDIQFFPKSQCIHALIFNFGQAFLQRASWGYLNSSLKRQKEALGLR